MGFHSHSTYRYGTSVAALYAAAGAATVGGELLAGETDAMGIDFTYHTDVTKQLYISDLTTPANNYNGYPQPKLTYTSPSLKMTRQSDGVWRYANHNLALRSQEIDNAQWGGFSSDAMTSVDSGVAPDGTTTADRKTWTQTGAPYRYHAAVATITGKQYQFSVWHKSADGSSHIWALMGEAATSVAVTSTTTWQRKTFVFTSTGASSFGFDFRIAKGADSTGDIYLWGAEFKAYPVNDAGGFTAATGYLATTSAAVYDLPYEWSAALASQGILIEEARTNICLQSDDFTNASWTKSNMTTAYTSTGPDGVANSASRLTASAGNATALQAITSGSATRISSFFVKRITGTGNIDITQDNGSTWATVTVTAGWTRVECASASLTNPTVGIRIVTSTDAVDVFRFQHEVGAFISSPIHTIAATVTRAADNLHILDTAGFPSSDSVGTMVAYIYPFSVSGGGGIRDRYLAMTDNIASDQALIYETGGFFTEGASVSSASNVLTANTLGKIAAAWAVTDMAVCTNGGTVATGSANATAPTVDRLRIGNGNGTDVMRGYLRQVTYLKRRATNGQLQTRTT